MTRIDNSNVPALELWETLTLQEASDRVNDFYMYTPNRSEDGDKYELGTAEDDPALLAAREDLSKVYQALERVMKAKGIAPQTPESYEFVKVFRPMDYPAYKS
jgi:hypothetical protein